MIEISLSEVAQILGCPNYDHNCTVFGVSRDSRNIQSGNLYIALQGERYDGHDFIAEAARKGASAALVTHPVDVNIPQIIVNDTLEALGRLSAHWRNRFTIPFIGVTGSNGKTTLKNMIASILNAACGNQANHILATEGNLNNAIGVPFTLLRLSPTHRYSVIEMGMNHFNEIAYLTNLTRPIVAVITNAAESHLEGVKSIAGVAQAKGEIFQGLPAEGIAVLNRDDAHFDYWRQLAGPHHYLTFGFSQAADIYTDYTNIHPHQPTLIHTPNGDIAITLPLLGKHNTMNALAATAATFALNIPLAAIQQGLEQVTPAPGRMRQLTLANQVTVIDDTYNANPFSLQAAVETLAAFSGPTLVVLGDMKELGENAKQLHFEAGRKIKQLGIRCLFTYGELSAEAQRGFGDAAYHFTDREQLIAALQPYLNHPLTAILVKGSRSMQMDKVVAALVPAQQLEHTH